ncbi:MAG: hypothetical protein ABR586_03640 [Thermoplasmatota archaeon]
MRVLPIALAGLMAAIAFAPTPAAQGPLPQNPFDQFACANGGGPGAVGFVATLVYLTCVFALSVGSVTYDFACFVVQGGGC